MTMLRLLKAAALMTALLPGAASAQWLN